MPLPQPVPDLISLDLLASVAALGSIRQAAMAHGISQPAASTRLRHLEGSLGVELLHRTSGGAQLTPAGRVVVGWSEQVLSDVRSILTATAALRRERRTSVHVAASMTVAEYLAPEWLVRVATIDPDLHVALDMANSEQVAELVREGRVDLGFVEGASKLVGLRSQTLLDDELVLVVAAHHPWASRRREVTARELAATPQVLREAGSGTREVLEEWLGERGLAVTALVELGSTTAIKRAVESGAAPAVLSRLAVSGDVRDGRLVVVPIAGGGPTRMIRALWSAASPLSPAAKRVLSQIQEASTER
ncbi:MAG TPA: LysR substrate-binding domain-containing protein [Acidimicrobiales bacterium]|nr:LysR substrate-binding domain-containing protein [Acidimicrobiales bacterium]